MTHMMIDDPDWVTKSCEKPLSISPVFSLALKNTKIFSFLLNIKDFKVSTQTLVYCISS